MSFYGPLTLDERVAQVGSRLIHQIARYKDRVSNYPDEAHSQQELDTLRRMQRLWCELAYDSQLQFCHSLHEFALRDTLRKAAVEGTPLEWLIAFHSGEEARWLVAK